MRDDDSGIDFDHPDLNVNATKSKSFIPDVTSADDENGHGTHVAGIIGAKNNTIGVLGVASGANLISLRVLDKDGNGKLSYILQALSYVSSNAKSGDVVNLSLGEDVVSDILDQTIHNITNCNKKPAPVRAGHSCMVWLVLLLACNLVRRTIRIIHRGA